jgi:hypothetical protein
MIGYGLQYKDINRKGLVKVDFFFVVVLLNEGAQVTSLQNQRARNLHFSNPFYFQVMFILY